MPGASVAGMALKAGVNANLLRNWIALDEASRNDAAATSIILPAPMAFVPVVEVVHDPLADEQRVPASAVPAPAAPLHSARLSARLPNGATVELECSGHDAALVAMPIRP